MLRLRALLEKGQLADALTGAQALLKEDPENRDVWYIVAVSQRYLKRIPDALATLLELERLHPDFSRLYQERGHCYVALRQAEPAIEAFLRAVHLNPALPASWNALKILMKMAGRGADAEMAAQHVATLAQLPPEIVTASSMFADGEAYPAERIVRDFLLKHGDHVEAMRLLAKIGMKLDVLDDAELLLERTLTLAPGYHAARYDYALTLLQRHKHVRALEELDRLLKVDPDNRAYRISYATACAGVGNNERAIELYREILEQTPGAADLHLSVGHALKTLGKQQEAIDSYCAAVACKPSFGDAYWSLANLKTYRFPDRRDRADARCSKRRLAFGKRTDITSASRSARRSRTGASMPNRSATTSVAMRSRRPRSAFGSNRLNAMPGCRRQCAHESFLRRAKDMASTAAIRSSSSACRGRAPRCSSRSSPPIRAWKGPWSCRTFCGS